MEENSIITDDDIAADSGDTTLAPHYYTSQRILSDFFTTEDGLQEDFCKKITDELKGSIVSASQELADKVYEQTLENFQSYLFSNAESNLQTLVYRQVNDIVSALLSGQEWAVNNYLLGEQSKYRNGDEIRKTIAKLIPKELQDARIADLEKQVEKLQARLACY